MREGKRKSRTWLWVILALLIGIGMGVYGDIRYRAPKKEPELTSAFVSGKLEAVSELTTARLTFTSALERKESRGSHYRTDYPDMDKEWNVWLKSRLKDGRIEITREPIPAEKFERYGIPVYPL